MTAAGPIEVNPIIRSAVKRALDLGGEDLLRAREDAMCDAVTCELAAEVVKWRQQALARSTDADQMASALTWALNRLEDVLHNSPVGDMDECITHGRRLVAEHLACLGGVRVA